MILVLIGLGTNVFGQPHQGSIEGRGDRIESLRIAFISQSLSLTPVYNQFHNDLKSLRNNFGMGPGKPQLTAEQSLDFEQKKLDLKKKYKAQFETVLGKEKLNTLYSLEEEFKKKLQELREERQQNRRKDTPIGRKF